MATITIRTEKVYSYDPEAERKRLRDNFKGDQLERQLTLLDLLEKEDFEELADAYDALPRDRDGTPEQEYAGEWTGVIFGGASYVKPDTESRQITITE